MTPPPAASTTTGSEGNCTKVRKFGVCLAATLCCVLPQDTCCACGDTAHCFWLLHSPTHSGVFLLLPSSDCSPFVSLLSAPVSLFLCAAIGVPNAASKKGRRTRRDTVALQRQARKDAADAAEASAAATLAEFAWGPAVEASDEEGDQEQDDMQQGQQEEEQSEDGMQQRGPEGGEEEEAQQKEQEQEQEEVVTQRQEKEEEKEEQKERQEACEVADPSGHSGPQEGSASA